MVIDDAIAADAFCIVLDVFAYVPIVFAWEFILFHSSFSHHLCGNSYHSITSGIIEFV